MIPSNVRRILMLSAVTMCVRALQDSITPTYACAVLWIDNERWSGIPFILKCGKALNERKTDIRIQFRPPGNRLFTDTSPNEIVLRIQPDEAVYMKITTKQPGLEGGSRHTELDLSYKKRFGDDAKSLPDAYERLILDVLRNDHNPVRASRRAHRSMEHIHSHTAPTRQRQGQAHTLRLQEQRAQGGGPAHHTSRIHQDRQVHVDPRAVQAVSPSSSGGSL